MEGVYQTVVEGEGRIDANGCQSKMCIAQVSGEDEIESEDIPPSDGVVLILRGLWVYCIVLCQTSPVVCVWSAGTIRRPADDSISHLYGHQSVFYKYVGRSRVIRRSMKEST